MRTNIYSFILESSGRKEIVKTILNYPDRLWGCSALEEETKIPHSTVFRTLKGLLNFGLMKSFKVNKKDIVYELVKDSPWTEELKNIITLEQRTIRKVAQTFIDQIKSPKLNSIILYGSSITGQTKQGSDIDILIMVKKHDISFEKVIFDKAGEYSSKINRTISIMFLDATEIKKERETAFIKSVKENMEVLYGEKPF